MPRGTLVTTLYSADILWLDAFERQLGDRSLLAILKGSFVPVAQPHSYGAQPIATAKRVAVILYSKAMLPVTCASTWVERSPLSSVYRVAPALDRGLRARQQASFLQSWIYHICGQYCNAQAHPTRRDFPFIAKITTVLSAKQLHRAPVFCIEIEKSKPQAGSERTAAVLGKLYIFMNFSSTESCSQKRIWGGRVLV